MYCKGEMMQENMSIVGYIHIFYDKVDYCRICIIDDKVNIPSSSV